MNDLEKMEWFENAHRQYLNIQDVSDWRTLNEAGIFRKHAGDIDGAIEALKKAINLTSPVPHLAEETATMLNYLAAELYSAKNDLEQAEEAIREAIKLTRSLNPSLLASDLLVLAGIKNRKVELQESMASAEEARYLFQQQGISYGVARAEELIERIRSELA